MRRAAKVDANHAEIVSALRAIGCSVQSLAQVGQGCPDILVGRDGTNFVFEVKADKGSLTPLQEGWHATWRGSSYVVRDADEAIRLVEFWSRK